MTVRPNRPRATTASSRQYVSAYLYLHPIKEQETRQSLVFRYGDDGGFEHPTISWKGERELVIRMKRVAQVSKMISSLDSVKIDYRIERRDGPIYGQPPAQTRTPAYRAAGEC
jgi:hypothetical protein